MRRKLFIPGPVEVHPELLQAMATPMIGHRDPEYSELHKRVKTKLQKMLFTKRPVFLSTSSAWGVMEGAVRNLVARRALNLMCGAFSDHWHEVTKSCGKEADPLQVEWGKAIKPEMVKTALATGKYDVVTLVYNETSTGVMNPVEEIAAVIREFPDVLFVVDAVSAMAGVKIEFDRLGLDVLLAGVQKAFGLPPGLAVFATSERAMERARKVPGRGFYFDFLEFEKFDQKDQTPSTPSISHIYALDRALDRIEAEGFDQRCARHQTMANACRKWVAERGFAMFPEKGYESVTLSTVANTRKIDVGRLNQGLSERGYVISDGYGKLKGKTFRIAHMADTTLDELNVVLGLIDEVVGKG